MGIHETKGARVTVNARWAHLRDRLEHHQVIVYFAAVVLAAAAAAVLPGTDALEGAINPALAMMLFVTFLQVPLADLGRAFKRVRFLGALMTSNFLIVPLLVAFLLRLLPADPMVRLGVLLVLLTPCIDYVVTFSHIGRADARLLLASTPALLIAPMLLLPVYLGLFLGDASADLVRLGPFVDAFVWLIAIPFALAAVVQLWAAQSSAGARIAAGLGLLPVPATALVLFIVVAAVVPQLGAAIDAALRVVPLYVAFAVVAPLIGWTVARVARLEVPAARAVAFSSATRNSLVVLPLALAVPGAIPVLPAVIVTQTMVELVSSVIYMRLMPKLGAHGAAQA
jgi:ACR3 family arsenite efflux pump ArsB